MKLCVVMALILGAILGVAQADFVLPMTTIGNPGNAWDQPAPDPDYYVGAVDYVYQISTYEITVGQYTDFLNHKAASDPYGLYHANMADPLLDGGDFILRSGTDGSYAYTTVAGKETQPVRVVSFYDGLRLANWMHNGQGNGDTETGAYTLTDGVWLTRNYNARWALPSEDEWHKAAHYDSIGESYWEYPNGEDTIQEPIDETTPRELNFGHIPFWHGSVRFTTTGQTTGQSAYGVCDMGGNVREWTDSLVPPGQGHWRVMRGGSYVSASSYLARASAESADPTWEGVSRGLRLVQLIPEPSTVLLILLGMPILLIFRRKE